MDDEMIIELYWKRSENAISETDIKYGSLCLYLAKNMLRNHQDAEECVNDTYLGAWNTMPPEKPDFLRAFIIRITRNLSLKKIEYNTAQKRNSEVATSYDELEECLSGAKDLEASFGLSELVGCINHFLEEENPEHRIVFVRRYWYFDSVNKIAYSLRLSESKVKSILFRMRNKLRSHLCEEGFINDKFTT